MKLSDLPAVGKFLRKTPVVPHVRLTGVIGALSPLRSGLTLQSVDKTLTAAFSVKRAVAVAISVNSPGGSPVQSNLIFRRIRQLSVEKKLPVLVYVEDVAASGGYMIACAADEIIVDPSSIVGSIGVVSAGFGLEKAIDRLGIERRVYTAGTRKVMLDPFLPENQGDIDHLKTLQAEIHRSFIALVRERRGDKLSGEADLFSGLFWTGEPAIQLGLADRIGTLHEDIRSRYGADAEIRPVSSERGFLRRRLMGAFAPTLPEAVVSVDEAITAIETRGHYSRYGL